MGPKNAHLSAEERAMIEIELHRLYPQIDQLGTVGQQASTVPPDGLVSLSSSSAQLRRGGAGAQSQSHKARQIHRQMMEPISTVEPATVWQAEATWAVQEWRARFDPEHARLRSLPGATANSRFYVLVGEAARRAFEEVADALLQRVRSVLASRSAAHHIGTPDECAAWLVEPLTQKTLDSIDKVADKSVRGRFPGYQNFIGAPLDKLRQKIKTRAATLRLAISAEVTLRLETISTSSRNQTTSAKASDSPANETASPFSTRWRLEVEWWVRQVQALRPRFYNGLTWAVVSGGLLFMGRPLWERLIEAILQREFDLQITSGGSDSLWGFGLVIAGLIYHAWHRAHEVSASTTTLGPSRWYARSLFLGACAGGLLVLAGSIWLQRQHVTMEGQFETQRLAIVAQRDDALRRQLDSHIDRFIADWAAITTDGIDMCSEGTAYHAAKVLLQRIDFLAQELSDGGAGYRDFVNKQRSVPVIRSISECTPPAEPQ